MSKESTGDRAIHVGLPSLRADFPDAPALLLFLDRAHQIRDTLNNRAVELTGITFDQALLLCIVDLAGGSTTVTQIADRLRRAQNTVSGRIKALETKGLIRRSRNRHGDGRQVLVSITSAGSQRLRRYRRAVREVLRAADDVP